MPDDNSIDIKNTYNDNKELIKEKFEAGDIPSANDFSELIDFAGTIANTETLGVVRFAKDDEAISDLLDVVVSANDLKNAIALVEVGVKYKKDVRLLANTSINIAEGNNTTHIDGVLLQDNDRVLLTKQVILADRRVWRVKLNRAWELADDFNIESSLNALAGSTVEIQEGEFNADSIWTANIEDDYLQWQKRPTYSGQNGIDINGLDISLDKAWANDHISPKTVELSALPNLPASKITEGILDNQHLPAQIDLTKNTINADSAVTAGAFIGNGSALEALEASHITTGVLSVQRVPNLNADKISSGTLSADRLPNLHADKLNDGVLNVNRLPPATQSEAGVVSLATHAQIAEKSTANVAVTPANLAEEIGKSDAASQERLEEALLYKANTQYVDNQIAQVQAGVKFKRDVAAVATDHVATANKNPELRKIDGYQLQEGDRVLLTGQNHGDGQTYSQNNNVWIARKNKAWELAEDFDGDLTGEITPGVSVMVVNGNKHQGSIWSIANVVHDNDVIVEIEWLKRPDINVYEAGQGIDITDNQVAVNLSWLQDNLNFPQTDLSTLYASGNIKANNFVASGVITPASGSSTNSGIVFPADPSGGTGDLAWLKYYTREGENTVLELGTNNDPEDHIALMASGNVGIGITTPMQDLHINGQAQADAFNIAFDTTQMTEVVALGDTLSKLELINAHRFRWKTETRNQREGVQMGLDMAKLEEQFPGVVSTNSDNVKTVDYSKLVVPLLKAINELNADIKAIKSLMPSTV